MQRTRTAFSFGSLGKLAPPSHPVNPANPVIRSLLPLSRFAIHQRINSFAFRFAPLRLLFKNTSEIRNFSMPIISQIGRKHWRTRALIAAMYLALLAGAVTMIYPFLLMLSGSTKSAVDAPTNRIIPAFLYNRVALYQKSTEALFNETLALMFNAYPDAPQSFSRLAEPAPEPEALVSAWTNFLHNRNPGPFTYTLGFTRAPASRGAQPQTLRAWKQFLFQRFDGDLTVLNRELETTYASWYALDLPPEDYLVRRTSLTETPFIRVWNEFKESRPIEERIYFSVENFYRNVFLMTRYTRDIAAYNAAHATTYSSWNEVHLDARYPDGPEHTDAEREDWESFVRVILNHQWIHPDVSAQPAYQRYLAAKYTYIASLDRVYKNLYTDWDEIPLPPDNLTAGLIFSDWDAFLQGWRDPDSGARHALPLNSIQIRSLDEAFRDSLKGDFATIHDLNTAWGTDFADWRDIAIPQRALHYRAFLAHQSDLRWEFATRNFVTVWDYIGRHGRGLINTAIYCLFAVLAALLVNPLAAYALSRYRPRFTYKTLLFFMLTMAFPPMVTQIPVFLLLRSFNLLNTFWALILPGLANGYAIFLLKGFFDSLPRELYESAEMDGAGEFKIFWSITMSLSKPILAVIALNAFTHAYSNFMFALLICQDSRMWTLMPWLYQLQQYSSSGVIYASLLIAAVPTLLIFALCQNIIMRGIVVPVEK